MSNLDVGEVGRTAAELMDVLADELADETDAKVDAVVVLVAISTAEWAGVRYRCSDRRPWIQRALLVEALELANDDDRDVSDGDPD